MRQIIITGASRGIGKELASLCIEADYQVIGTSRNPDTIPETERIPGVAYAQLDLGSDASIDTLCDQFPSIDVIVHNAGISQIGASEDVPSETLKELFQTNLFGIMRLNSFYTKQMRQRGSGRIIHVSSLAARTPVPFSSIYAATKAALDAYAFALRNEVHQHGITVANVFFDFVRTDLPQIASILEGSDYHGQVIAAREQRDQSIAAGMEPSFVAGKMLKALNMKNPPLFIPIGKRTRRMYLLRKFLPVSWVERLIRLRYELT